MPSAFVRAAALLALAGLAACSTQAPPPAAPTPAPVLPPITNPPPPPAPPPVSADRLAARFPDPAVNYRTPAFNVGRVQGLTTNAELQSWAQALARDTPPVARVVRLGASQKGLPLDAVLLSREADVTPAALKATGKPVVALIGQQRGDEGASAEALMVVAQELARGSLKPLLDRLHVLVLPRANPDAAVDAAVTTANGTDLDRDHLWLKTPEALAQARLVRDYQPVLVAYAAEYALDPQYLQKFGALQSEDVLVQHATTPNLAPFVTKAVDEWVRQPLMAQLARQGLSADWWHTPSDDASERKLAMGSVRPDTARNVQGLRNELSLMIATRGAGLGRQHLKRRVHAQVVAMGSVLTSAAQRGGDLLKLRSYVDAEVASQSCQGEVVLEAAPTATEYAVQLLDPVTVEPRRVTVSWDSALVLGNLRSRPRPCGYWLDADQTEAVSRLRAMGVRVEQVLAKGVVQGDGYVEGASPRRLETVSSLLDMLPGSYYVPLAQPLANLVVAALEPDTSFSFVAGGVVSSPRKVARVMALPGTRLNAMP
jgi:hypothetical protein